MVKVLSEDVEALQETIEMLAYNLGVYEHPHWYEIPDEEIVRIIQSASNGAVQAEVE